MVLRPDNFTEQAQQVITRSQDLVHNYQHTQWDCEHMLLALISIEAGVPVKILEELGVSPEAMKTLRDYCYFLHAGTKVSVLQKT